MAERYDLIVIGAGAAGLSAARRATRDYGARVVMVDRGAWGGACALVACKPTKAYVEAARLARDLRVMGPQWGGDGALSFADVKRWKDELVGTPERWRERYEAEGWETAEGTARFEDAHTLEVGGRRLAADRILIATGSKPAVPPIDGLDALPWLDSARALELEEPPESLLVIGAGPVGLELAQVFARFGSRVTVAGRGVAGRADADAAAALRSALVDEGIDIRDGAVEALAPHEDRIVGRMDNNSLEVSHVLVAAGRVPDVDDLEVERAGIERNARGVVVDEHLRTTAAGVWAAGDAAGRFQLTAVGDYEAKVAVDDMFTDAAPVADYSALPTCIFTDPELASIGSTEQQAREDGHDVEAVTYPVENVLRASYTDSTAGLFKLVFDRSSRRVLGIHVVSRGAGEIVQGYAPAFRLGMTIENLVDTHYVYPSYGEGVREAAELASRAVVRA